MNSFFFFFSLENAPISYPCFGFMFLKLTPQTCFTFISTENKNSNIKLENGYSVKKNTSNLNPKLKVGFEYDTTRAVVQKKLDIVTK